MNPALTGTKAALRYHLELAPGASAADPSCVSAPKPATWATVSTPCWPSARQEADEYFASLAARRYHARRSAGPAPGGGRDAVVQAVLPLRRAALAGRRPDAAAPPAAEAGGAELRLGARLQSRGDLHARLVGVPVVRVVGPRFPRRGAGPSRPELRQVTTAPAVPRVVHAPQRPAPGLRMGLRRRQPARPGVGGHGGVAHRQRQREPPKGLPPDNDFLERMFHKLLINFTWWVNRKDAGGQQRLRGRLPRASTTSGFSTVPGRYPCAGVLEQSDGTAWMAMYCISLLEMALRLADTDPTYEDVAIKFYEHFAYIASAMHSQGLWDIDDGFFYDVIRFADGERVPRSKCVRWSASYPLLAVTTLHPSLAAKLPEFTERTAVVRGEQARAGRVHSPHPRAWAWATAACCPWSTTRSSASVLRRVLDPDEMLSPHGVRSLSRYHLAHPFSLEIGGDCWSRSTTSRPSRRRPCSGAIPTGVARSGSRSITCSSRPSTATSRYFDDQLEGRAPGGVRQPHEPAPRWPTTSSRRLVSTVPPGPGRAPARARRQPLCCRDDPAWQRPDLVPRVLRRRHWRRPRRLAPDWLDGAGGPSDRRARRPRSQLTGAASAPAGSGRRLSRQPGSPQDVPRGDHPTVAQHRQARPQRRPGLRPRCDRELSVARQLPPARGRLRAPRRRGPGPLVNADVQVDDAVGNGRPRVGRLGVRQRSRQAQARLASRYLRGVPMSVHRASEPRA